MLPKISLAETVEERADVRGVVGGLPADPVADELAPLSLRVEYRLAKTSLGIDMPDDSARELRELIELASVTVSDVTTLPVLAW